MTKSGFSVIFMLKQIHPIRYTILKENGVRVNPVSRVKVINMARQPEIRLT